MPRGNYQAVIEELKKKQGAKGAPSKENSRGKASSENRTNQMSELLNDMQGMKRTRKHRSLSGILFKKNSKEFSNVKKSLRDVVEYTGGSFSSDVSANSKMMNGAVKSYNKLIAACNTYLSKKGDESEDNARTAKVKQILEMALMDYESVKTLSYGIRSMSAEEQAGLKWLDILNDARTIDLEVDDLSSFKALGDKMKTGDDAGRLIPGVGVFTREQKFNVSDMVAEAKGTDTMMGKDNFITVAYNEAKGDTFSTETVGETFNQSNRNVATSRIANLLGIGNVVEQSRSVKVKEKNGKITKGNLMTLAKGKEAGKTAEQEIIPQMKKVGNIQERMDKLGAMFSPMIQKELSSLQVLDYICGQTDRHANNYFLEKDKSGNFIHIHGIDNDMSFGTGVDYGKLVKEKAYHNIYENMRMVVDGDGNLSIPHMDKQLAQNIKQLSEDEFRFALEDLIEPAFIDAAVKRLKIVQDAIKKEEGNGNSDVFISGDSGWGKKTHKKFIHSTGEMKMKEKEVGTKGVGQYFEFGDYYDKNDQYEGFRQNSYYGELMMAMMGYNGRRFERE